MPCIGTNALRLVLSFIFGKSFLLLPIQTSGLAVQLAIDDRPARSRIGFLGTI